MGVEDESLGETKAVKAKSQKKKESSLSPPSTEQE